MSPAIQRSWSTGHGSYAFAGIAAFEGGATSFLAEGARRNERLMLVADDPRRDLWPKSLIDRGDLVIASTAEVYGAMRMVDAVSQREIFALALSEALQMGYGGIRVAADNTSLIEGSERLEAWGGWETLAEEFMATSPMTSLCSFDRSRIDAGTLRAVLEMHRIVVSRDE